jgi:16S rRNA U1498 N3-methylase RsmE
LNNTSTWHNLGPWICWGRGNEIAKKLTRDGSVLTFVGPEGGLWAEQRKKYEMVDG